MDGHAQADAPWLLEKMRGIGGGSCCLGAAVEVAGFYRNLRYERAEVKWRRSGCMQLAGDVEVKRLGLKCLSCVSRLPRWAGREAP
jgi:hypothetical protein